MIKNVLFDFDGTIADTLPLVVKSLKEAAEPFSARELTYKDIEKTFGPSEEGSLLRLAPENYNEALQLFYRCYEKYHVICPKPFDGIIPLMRRLKKRGAFIGLVTGKCKSTTKISLEKYRMGDIFDAVKTGSIHESIKTLCIKQILHERSLNPNETVYIGDMPGDIDAAKDSGVKSISVLYASLQKESVIKAKHPDEICRSVEELAGILL